MWFVLKRVLKLTIFSMEFYHLKISNKLKGYDIEFRSLWTFWK